MKKRFIYPTSWDLLALFIALCFVFVFGCVIFTLAFIYFKILLLC